jgi:predicted AAA+ superfamily ATPase
MIDRRVFDIVRESLRKQACVALLGPRQVGKTTLAHQIAQGYSSYYLDLEQPEDRLKLENPKVFFQQNQDKLIILDEVQFMPEIFMQLRGVIDQYRREGKRYGHFLILGSANIDLLKQSSETLAGRITYIQMTGFNVLEILESQQQKLWVRGGIPDSYLARSDQDSFQVRKNFIKSYLERDIPLLGPRIPAERLRRLWMMLAHNQGTLLNSTRLASSLGITSPTVNHYIDLLVDLLLVRRLEPYYLNIGKRLAKSPKTYIRDSGILHCLLNIQTYDDLLGHPIIGPSWEGFAIENILSNLSIDQVSFYRTARGAEIDLVIDWGVNRGLWAVEIKNSLAPKPPRGFYTACEDLKPKRSFIVYPGNERYPISNDAEVISLREMCLEIQGM